MIRLIVATLLLLPILAQAEYDELTKLRAHGAAQLTLYATRMSQVDPKFEGVQAFGKSLLAIEDVNKVDVDALTIKTRNYWRAVLEMTPDDPTVLFAHAYLHVARGELSRAETLFLLGYRGMHKRYQADIEAYEALHGALTARATAEMATGIAHHDAGEFMKAIAVYDAVIAEYPDCAWAYYEKGFSYMILAHTDPKMEAKSVAMFAETRARHRFYWMAYQGKGPQVQQLMILITKVSPYVSGEDRKQESFRNFAIGCEEVGFYEYAAHSRWKLITTGDDEPKARLAKLVELIEKSGCPDGDFFRGAFGLDANAEDAPADDPDVPTQ